MYRYLGCPGFGQATCPSTILMIAEAMATTMAKYNWRMPHLNGHQRLQWNTRHFMTLPGCRKCQD